MIKKRLSILISFFVYGLFALTMLACSSGGDSAAPAPVTLSGTAATGKAVVGVVYVRGANGNMVSAKTDSIGAYVAAVENLKAPFLLRVIPNDGSEALYSYGTKPGQTVNVTSLTNLAVFMASGDKDLSAVFSSWKGKSVLASAVADAQKIINANLRSRFSAAGLNANDYNFITTTFSANGAGIDGVMDDVVVAVNSTGGNFTVAILPQPGFAFDVKISVAGINVGFAGGGGDGSAGTLAITTVDPDLPASFAPAAGIDVTVGINATGLTRREVVWAIALDAANNKSLSLAVVDPAGTPRVRLAYADMTNPANPRTKIWNNYSPGVALVIDLTTKTVTFTGLEVHDYIYGGLPATLDGVLDYQ